jgi:hypothetical protein
MTSLAEVVAQQPPKGGACSGASRLPVSFVVFRSIIPASNASTTAFDPDDVAARRAAPSRARASIGVPNAADIAPDRTSRRSD